MAFGISSSNILTYFQLNRITTLTHLDKCIGLGYEIHHKQNPLQSLNPPVASAPKNAKMDDKGLEWLKTKWLSLVDNNEISEHIILYWRNSEIILNL